MRNTKILLLFLVVNSFIFCQNNKTKLHKKNIKTENVIPLTKANTKTMNFYNLSAKKPSGEIVEMSSYKGKVILIVNTATKCGLTPQFKGLEKLHQDYKDKGLVVIGFPCNQFLGQEPLSNEEMEKTCLLNHGVTFQLFEKINVNGKNAHPIYKYLKKSLKSGFFSSRIKWNFEKFIIDKEGNPVKRFSPKTKPGELEVDIIKLLEN